MAPSTQMTRAELTAYVAEHENEYVQQYVKALYEEHDELTNQLDAIARSGYSDDGREAMREAGRILLLVAVIAIAYIVGSSSH